MALLGLIFVLLAIAMIVAAAISGVGGHGAGTFVSLSLLATFLSALSWGAALAVAGHPSTGRALPLSAVFWYARYGIWLAIASFAIALQLGASLEIGFLALVVTLGAVSWVPALFAKSPRARDIVSISDPETDGFATAKIVVAKGARVDIVVLKTSLVRRRSVMAEELSRAPDTQIRSLSSVEYKALKPRLIWRHS